MEIITNLEDLGFSAWLKEQINNLDSKDFNIARVIAVNKENFTIKDTNNELVAKITGKLMFGANSSLDYPTVGDWVYAQYLNDDSYAIIHQILPRKTFLTRKTAGKKIAFQLLAANIDTAFIMQSIENFNSNRLERYLVMINENKIQPVVLLSKSDLVSNEELEDKISKIRAAFPNIQTLTFSNINGFGLNRIQELLHRRKTYCLLGSSGVGKTTLLNTLHYQNLFETQEVREKDGKGRHTTTRRQLSMLNNGAMIIDTPGMRELGAIGVESGIKSTFDDISHLSTLCRFNNCSHVQENGCAILASLEKGEISQKRYQNYLKMKRESIYNEMSYYERRDKDRRFGKFCKSVMKHKKMNK